MQSTSKCIVPIHNEKQFFILLTFSYLAIAAEIDIDICSSFITPNSNFHGKWRRSLKHDQFWLNVVRFLCATDDKKHQIQKICCIVHSLWDDDKSSDFDKLQKQTQLLDEWLLNLYHNVSYKHIRIIRDALYQNTAEKYHKFLWRFALTNKLISRFDVNQKINIPLAIFYIFYVLSRFVFVLFPFGVIINWIIINDLSVIHCMVIVSYLLCLITWILILKFITFPLVYDLWHIFCALCDKFYFMMRSGEIESIRKLFDGINDCECRENLVVEMCGDIGNLINEFIGREYLIEMRQKANKMKRRSA